MNPFTYIRTVLWSFFGIRQGSAARNDISQLRPLPLVLTGLLLAGLFVALLATLARVAVAGFA